MTIAPTTVCDPEQRRVPDSGADRHHDNGARPRLRRPAPAPNSAASIAAGVMVVICVLARFPDRLLHVTGLRSWAPALVGVIVLVNGARVLAQAPFTFTQRPASAARWAARQVATLSGAIVVAAVLTIPLYALIRASTLWWLWAWALFAAVTVAAQAAMPLVIRAQTGPSTPAPPLLSERVRAIGILAGVDVGRGVRVAGARTSGPPRYNAYVVGLGRTRQVVLEAGVMTWPSELIDQVVAHELGHWRLGHIRRRLPITIIAQLATFALAAQVLSVRPLLELGGVAAAGDPRSYPLLLALTTALALPARLLLARYDRAQERAADRFALEVLSAPDDFVSMLDRAAIDGGAPRHLPRWRRSVAGHPPIEERILACQSFARSA